MQGENRADVAVIGAGFNGLRAALVLAEAGVSTAVFDAGEVGWGASGRNGGQVNPIGHEPPGTIAKRWGPVVGTGYAERYASFIIQTADELFDVVDKYRIECDAEQNGWIRAVHAKAAIAEFEKAYRGWRGAGAEMVLIDQAELERLSGTRGYHMGWLAKSGGSIHPLSYARGLARAALKAGARIFSHSPVTQLKRVSQKWQLQADRGKLMADQVLICTNGYTDDLVPRLKQSLIPVISIQGATPVLSEEQNAAILPGRHTFADTRRVIFYFRKTADKRLIFGTAGTSDTTLGMAERQRILKGLGTVYPQFRDLTLDYIWGGRIAVTRDILPHIHQPAPGITTALGCNGRGVALSTAMGRLLAELVLGTNPKDLPIPITNIHPFPFHRFHRLGLSAIVKWKTLRDHFETRI